MSGVFTPGRLERDQQHYRLPTQDTISRRAAGACHQGCECGSVAGFWCKLCFNANLQIRSHLNSLAYIVPHCAKNGRLHLYL